MTFVNIDKETFLPHNVIQFMIDTEKFSFYDKGYFNFKSMSEEAVW